MKKTCGKCKEAKPLDDFSKDKRSKDGLQSRCKACQKLYDVVYVKLHYEKRKAYALVYDRANREKRRVYRRRYYQSTRGYLCDIFNNMKTRCRREKTYAAIEVKFVSLDDFVNYVVNKLKVDPVGLVCHRKDNDRHYEKGNIEFMTKGAHLKLHAELRKKK